VEEINVPNMRAGRSGNASTSPEEGNVDATAREGHNPIANICQIRCPKGRSNRPTRSNTIAIFMFDPPGQGSKNRIDLIRMGSVPFILVRKIDG